MQANLRRLLVAAVLIGAANKRDRDLASRDLLHEFGGCQVRKIVPIRR
jgi:hypothetical protein